MTHIHPDQLAALALEPDLAEDDDDVHLHDCAQCRRELDVLREVSARARRAHPDDPPPAPPESVWDRVLDELTASDDLYAVEPVEHRPVWRQPWAAAAALLVVVVVSAVALLRFDGGGAVVAQATLEPLAQVPEASASLVIDDGTRTLSVDEPALPEIDGYYELWLLTADGSRLVSLGPITGAGSYTIPTAIDTDVYAVVDISREPPDGDPSHSSDSVLRGPLQPTA
jgi:anti-sigma-K factor RskA